MTQDQAEMPDSRENENPDNQGNAQGGSSSDERGISHPTTGEEQTSLSQRLQKLLKGEAADDEAGIQQSGIPTPRPSESLPETDLQLGSDPSPDSQDQNQIDFQSHAEDQPQHISSVTPTPPATGDDSQLPQRVPERDLEATSVSSAAFIAPADSSQSAEMDGKTKKAGRFDAKDAG